MHSDFLHKELLDSHLARDFIFFEAGPFRFRMSSGCVIDLVSFVTAYNCKKEYELADRKSVV